MPSWLALSWSSIKPSSTWRNRAGRAQQPRHVQVPRCPAAPVPQHPSLSGQRPQRRVSHPPGRATGCWNRTCHSRSRLGAPPRPRMRAAARLRCDGQAVQCTEKAQDGGFAGARPPPAVQRSEPLLQLRTTAAPPSVERKLRNSHSWPPLPKRDSCRAWRQRCSGAASIDDVHGTCRRTGRPKTCHAAGARGTALMLSSHHARAVHAARCPPTCHLLVESTSLQSPSSSPFSPGCLKDSNALGCPGWLS